MAELIADNSGANQRLKEQDASLARSGESLRRDDYRQAFQGLFATPGVESSFSYLVTREAVVSEQGTTMKLREVNAVSTILHSGRLLLVSVIDQSEPTDRGTRARDITARWLRAFKGLN